MRSIFWFRQDLRLADNPGLLAATQSGAVLPIYILDDASAGEHKMGAASRWWLHHSLQSLNHALAGRLNLYVGDTVSILLKIAQEHDINNLYWNRCYEPWRIKEEAVVITQLLQAGIACHHFNGSLLWEPGDILKADGTPYKVFTPFYSRGRLKSPIVLTPLEKPNNMALIKDNDNSMTLEELDLLPKIHWHDKMNQFWQIGEEAAQKKLDEFLEQNIIGYKINRDYPAKAGVSRLSPHLHFGEISPHQILHQAHQVHAMDTDLECFLKELGWREFSYYLLYHFPKLPTDNFQAKFNKFPWHYDARMLEAWQRGCTGIPIVDAGMRELWQTGYMHNRVRMVVASFLVKNLLIHWHHGAQWFWDCLVDADLANNSASWQWVAGCGADAAPYFRIFNPVLQGEKFDPDGNYTRHFVPELKQLPNRYLHKPWKAPDELLASCGLKLGDNYPYPIIDLASSRSRALKSMKLVMK